MSPDAARLHPLTRPAATWLGKFHRQPSSPRDVSPSGGLVIPGKGNDVVHVSASDLLPGHSAMFDRYADQGPHESCWKWRGPFDRYGYGVVIARQPEGGRRRVGAHRVAYLLTRGDIPSDLVLDHLCRNRGCVNPWHLEPVTNHVNTLRQRLSGVCRSGKHEMTPENTYERGGHRRCRECMRAGFRRANRKRRAA